MYTVTKAKLSASISDHLKSQIEHHRMSMAMQGKLFMKNRIVWFEPQ